MFATVGNQLIWQGFAGPSRDGFIEASPADLKHTAFDLLSGKGTRWDTVQVKMVAQSADTAPAFASVDFRRRPSFGTPMLDSDIGTRSFPDQGIETRFGWSVDPAWAQWIWTDGPYAELQFPMPPGVKGAMDISVEAHAFLAPGHDQQQIEVYVDGNRLQTWAFASPETQRLTITVDHAASREAVRLGFKMLNPAAPQNLGLGKDMRKLGLALHSVRLSNHPNTSTGKP